VVALVLAGAVLASLPALAGGLQVWVGERVEPPSAVVDPGVEVPVATPPLASGAGAEPDPGDDRDRDDDSGGSGRSGGGGSSGPG
jgi:hypothetical protein